MPKKDSDYIPSAAKKQGKKAEEALKAAKAAKEKPAVDPTAAPDTDPGAAKEVPVSVDPEPAPAKPADETFEHKYNTLQGMYNRDTHELRAQLEGLQAATEKQDKIIANLSNVLETMPQQAAQQAAPAIVTTKAVDSHQFSGYGTEMVDFIERFNELISRVDALESAKSQATAQPDGELAARLSNVEATQQMTVQDTFYEELATAIPDWGVQNRDPKFALWLEDVDPMSQVPRKTLLKYAFERWNYKQVIALFKAFRGGDTPAAIQNEDQSDGLAGQVVPDTTGNANDDPGGQPAKVYSTKEDFIKAQDDFTKGRITEEDFDKISDSYQTGLSKR
jgi:hypothetical protein